MKYFNGFCLKGEEELFAEYLQECEFCVAGFSFGAQKALEYALYSKKRVDKLQLFSPAFFSYSKKAVDINLHAFEKNKDAYIKNFLTKAGLYDKKYLCSCTKDELVSLFTFDWEKISLLKGVKIEIFIGEFDKIIDSKKAYGFFKNYADVYLIKKANHFLRS